MKTTAIPVLNDKMTLRILPRWIPLSCGETLASVSFASGAALAVLDVVLCDGSGTLPRALLQDRMALGAAVACLKLEGRNESAGDIRDAVCLARPGEALGPSGDMFVTWRRLARINLKGSNWRAQLIKLLPRQVAEAMPELKPQDGSPVAQASDILAAGLRAFPHQEAAALMLGDVTLARAIGWDRPIPLLAAHLTRKDICAIADGEGAADLCVHRAIVAASDAAIRSAADLSRRGALLGAIAPKLRAKGAERALALFLSHDAISPSGMLAPVIMGTSFAMTDRSARRLCDRLVELGVVRELTGRSTFRLYGV